jgi:S1-C subfamily serine protease
VVVEWDDDLAEGEVALEQSTVANAEEGEGVLERLSASGLSRDRAEEVLRRESQLRRAAAFAEYRATGTIGPLNAWPADVEQTRAELGDADYERYLQATGQQTRVIVGDVEPASAAANAGIIPEDQILAYAGRRVFNLRDLNALMLRTSSGETVAATVVRDGQTLQLYVTGGPLGLSQLRMR